MMEKDAIWSIVAARWLRRPPQLMLVSIVLMQRRRQQKCAIWLEHAQMKFLVMRRLDIGGWRAMLYGAKNRPISAWTSARIAPLERSASACRFCAGRYGPASIAREWRLCLANLLGKQVLEVELGLHRAEHEVGVVEAQVLLVGVGREGAATACPVLERGGCGLAGE